jgi:hypothetical protein
MVWNFSPGPEPKKGTSVSPFESSIARCEILLADLTTRWYFAFRNALSRNETPPR